MNINWICLSTNSLSTFLLIFELIVFSFADYYVPIGIVIIQDNDSIRVGKYQMLNGGESDPRNKTLMKMFNLIDIGERTGSGIPKLLKV